MPPRQPVLETERLRLRPFCLDDAPRVRDLAGDPAIARTTLHIPHPYPEGAAERWIATHASTYYGGGGATFAVCLKDGALIGCAGLGATPAHRRAELGYWIGVAWWNQGYCTEAARAVIAFGFREMGLHKIASRHFASNPASGRVMEKAGMAREGLLRGHFCKDGAMQDSVEFGTLNPDT